MLDAFGVKLAILSGKSDQLARCTWYGYPRIKEIAVANHLVINAEAYVGEKLRLILFADHVVRIAQTDF